MAGGACRSLVVAALPVEPVMFRIVAFILLIVSARAAAGVEKLRSLSCVGGDIRFTVTFDAESSRASVSSNDGISTYSVVPDGRFLAWRLDDAQGQPRYVIIEGDRVNGDLGWYFEPIDGDGQPARTRGTCREL